MDHVSDCSDGEGEADMTGVVLPLCESTSQSGRTRLLAFAKHSGLWVVGGGDLRVIGLNDGTSRPRVVGASPAPTPRPGKQPMEAAPAVTSTRELLAALRKRCPLTVDVSADAATLTGDPGSSASTGAAAEAEVSEADEQVSALVSDGHGEMLVYPLHGRSLGGHDRLIVVSDNRLKLVLVSPDHLIFKQALNSEGVGDRHVRIELNRRELTGLLWYLDWDGIFDEDPKVADFIGHLFRGVTISAHSDWWLRAALDCDCEIAVVALEHIAARSEKALRNRPAAEPSERARLNEVFATVATVTTKLQAAVVDVDDGLLKRLAKLLPRWSAELARLMSLAHAPGLTCSARRLASTGFYRDEDADEKDVALRRFSTAPGATTALWDCVAAKTASGAAELPWGLACTVPVSTTVATQRFCTHSSGERIEFFASSIGAPQWALTGSTDGEIAVWSTLLGLQHAAEFNCRAQNQLAPMDEQDWLNGPMVGVHLLCHHLPLGAICVISVFNTDESGPVVRIHTLPPDLSTFVQEPPDVQGGAVGGGNAESERPLQCKLCLNEHQNFASPSRLAQHMVDAHAEQSQLFERYSFNEASWALDYLVVLCDVFASALLEAPNAHWLLLAATSEVGEPLLAVGNVHDFQTCCLYPNCTSTSDSAADTLRASWRSHSLADFVDPDLWHSDGQIHIDSIGEPFSSYAAVLVDQRTSVLLVNIETGDVVPVYTSLGPTVADYDVDMVRGVVGIVHDDGTVANSKFDLSVAERDVPAGDDDDSVRSDRRAEQLEQSHRVLRMMPIPVTKLVASVPGYCTWQLACGADQRHSAVFEAIQPLGVSRSNSVLELGAHFRELYFVTAVRIECSFLVNPADALPKVTVRYLTDVGFKQGTTFSFGSYRQGSQPNKVIVVPMLFTDNGLSVTATRCLSLSFVGGGEATAKLPFKVRVFLSGTAYTAVRRNTLALPRTTILDFTKFDQLFPDLLRIAESHDAGPRLRDSAIALLHTVLVRLKRRKHILRVVELADFTKIIVNGIVNKVSNLPGRSKTTEFLIALTTMLRRLAPTAPCSAYQGCCDEAGWCRSCPRCRVQFVVFDSCMQVIDTLKTACRTPSRLQEFFELLLACKGIDDTAMSSALLRSLMEVAKEVKDGVHKAPIYAHLRSQCNECDYIFEPSCFALPLSFQNGIHQSMDGTPDMYGQMEPVGMVLDQRSRGVDLKCPAAGEHMLTARHKLTFRTSRRVILDLSGPHRLTHVAVELKSDNAHISVHVGSSSVRRPDNEVFAQYLDMNRKAVVAIPSENTCRYVAIDVVLPSTLEHPHGAQEGGHVGALGSIQHFAAAPILLIAAYGVPVCDIVDGEDDTGMQQPLLVVKRLRAQDAEACRALENRQRALKRLMSKPQASKAQADGEMIRIAAAMRAARLAMAQVYCARWAWIQFALENSNCGIEPPPLLDCRLSRLSALAHALIDACKDTCNGSSVVAQIPDDVVDQLFGSICTGQPQRMEANGVELLKILPISQWTWSRVIIHSLQRDNRRGGGVKSAEQRYSQLKKLALDLGFRTASPSNPLLQAIVEMVIPWIKKQKMEVALLAGSFKLFLDIMTDVEHGGTLVPQHIGAASRTSPDLIRIQVVRSECDPAEYMMSPRTPFNELIVRYATQFCVSRTDVEFIYSGQTITPDQTAMDVDMSTGAVILVRPKRGGKRPPTRAAEGWRPASHGVPYRVPGLPHSNCFIRVAPHLEAEVIGHFVAGSRLVAMDFQGDWMKISCSMQDEGAVWRIDRPQDTPFLGWVQYQASGVDLVVLDTTSQPWNSFTAVRMSMPSKGLEVWRHNISRQTCFANLLGNFADVHGIDPVSVSASCCGRRVLGFQLLSDFTETHLDVVLTPAAQSSEESTHVTLRVISTATYLHRDIDSAEEPKPIDNVETLFVKFAKSASLGNLQAIYSTQESSLSNKFTIQYNGTIRRHADTPAELGMADMSSVFLSISLDNEGTCAETKGPAEGHAAHASEGTVDVPKADALPDRLPIQIGVDCIASMTSSLIPAQLFGILAHPSVSNPVRPTVFVLITKSLMKVFGSCDMPSLVSILQHQEMPGFLLHIANDRNDDAREHIKNLVRRIIAVTTNLLGAMTGDHAPAVLVHPSPVAYFIRNVCVLIENALSSAPPCRRSRALQLSFLLETLLPSQDVLAQRCDLHCHHGMTRATRSVQCSICKTHGSAVHGRFGYTCSESGCDFSLCTLCMPLPTISHVLEYLSEESVVELITSTFPRAIVTDGDRQRCSMVLQLAAYVSPAALVKKEAWWRGIELVIQASTPSLVWRALTVLQSQVKNTETARIVSDELHAVLRRVMSTLTSSGCEGMWQMLRFLCDLWLSQPVYTGEDGVLFKQYVTLIATTMRHSIYYGKHQVRTDVGFVNKWLSCFLFMLNDGCRALLATHPVFKYDDESKMELGFMLSAIPLRMDVWSSHNPADSGEGGSEKVNVILRGLMMSKFKELDDILQAPLEACELVRHNDLRLLAGASMLRKCLMLPFDDFFAAEKLALATARLGVTMVQSGAFSLILSVMHLKETLPIYLEHLGPVVVDLVHNVAVVLSGNVPLVKTPALAAEKDGLPSQETIMEYAERGLHFLQLVALHSRVSEVVSDTVAFERLIDDLVNLVPYYHELASDVLAAIASQHKERAVDIVKAVVDAVHLPQSKIYSEVIDRVAGAVVETPQFDECAVIVYNFLMTNPYEMFTSLGSMMRVLAGMMDVRKLWMPSDASDIKKLAHAVLEQAVRYINYSFESMSEEILFSIACSATAPGDPSAGQSKVASEIARKFSTLLSAIQDWDDKQCTPQRDKYAHALHWILRPGTRVRAKRRHGEVMGGSLGTFISSASGVCWDSQAPMTELIPYEELEVVREADSDLYFSRRGIVSCVNVPNVTGQGKPLASVADVHFGQIVAIISESAHCFVVRDSEGCEHVLPPEALLELKFAEDLLVEPAEVNACRGAMAIVSKILHQHPELIDGFLTRALGLATGGRVSDAAGDLSTTSAALEHLAGALVMTNDAVAKAFQAQKGCYAMRGRMRLLMDPAYRLSGLREHLPTLRLLAHGSRLDSFAPMMVEVFDGLVSLARKISDAAQSRFLCPHLQECANFFIGIVVRNYESISTDAAKRLMENNTWEQLPPEVGVRLFWHLDVVAEASQAAREVADRPTLEKKRGLLRPTGHVLRSGDAVRVNHAQLGDLLWTGTLNSVARSFFVVDCEGDAMLFPHAMFKSGEIRLTRIADAIDATAREPNSRRGSLPLLLNENFISNLSTSGALSTFLTASISRFNKEPIGSPLTAESARIFSLQRLFRVSRAELNESAAVLASALTIPGLAQQLLMNRVGASVLLALAGYFDPSKCTAEIGTSSLNDFIYSEVRRALTAASSDGAGVAPKHLCHVLSTLLGDIDAQNARRRTFCMSFDLDDVLVHAAYRCALSADDDGTWHVAAARRSRTDSSHFVPHVIIEGMNIDPPCATKYFELKIASFERATVAIGLMASKSKDIGLISDQKRAVPTSGVWYLSEGCVVYNGRRVATSISLPQFRAGDCVGCGVNFQSKIACFTLNGKIIAAFPYADSNASTSLGVAIQGTVVCRPAVLHEELTCPVSARTTAMLSSLVTGPKWLRLDAAVTRLRSQRPSDGIENPADNAISDVPLSVVDRQELLLIGRLSLVAHIVAVQPDIKCITDALLSSSVPALLTDLMSVESCTTVNANINMYEHVIDLISMIYPAAFPDDLAVRMHKCIQAMADCMNSFMRTRYGAIGAGAGAAPETVAMAKKVCGLLDALKSRRSTSDVGRGQEQRLQLLGRYQDIFAGHRVDSCELELCPALAARAEETMVGSRDKMERLISEISDFAASLPCDSTHAIFVRYDEDNMDQMQTLITGASDTPYDGGCFLFDILCPADYPDCPPLVQLITTGHGTLRFNPNLYVTGKVCLSLLGTWEGESQETWTQESSLYQVFTSIQSLIMHGDVYFNEPNAPEKDAARLNIGYCNIIRYGTIRFAVLEHLIRPPTTFKRIIFKHLHTERDRIIRVHDEWIRDAEAQLASDNMEEKPLYSGLVELHNRELSRRFAASQGAYLNALRKEAARARKMLNDLEDPGLEESDYDPFEEEEEAQAGFAPASPPPEVTTAAQ